MESIPYDLKNSLVFKNSGVFRIFLGIINDTYLDSITAFSNINSARLVDSLLKLSFNKLFLYNPLILEKGGFPIIKSTLLNL